MLAGFHEMDEHFRTAPFERNLPVLLGLLAVWYNNFFGAQTVAVLPYEQYLKRFPAYLQQLTMESNGKHVTLDGTRVDYDTGPDLLGRARHQRPALVLPADPPGHAAHPLRLHRVREGAESARPHHDMLIANVFAQAEALAFGKTAEEVKAEGTPDWLVPHRVFEGNRPSNTILLDQLTPAALGKLVALYEHSVFTQGTIWSIDSFDQWGVELGKVLAQRIIPELESAAEAASSRTTARPTALIRRYRRRKGTPMIATQGAGPRALMTPRGYDQPLYILPFDHRGSFETKMFGWNEPLDGRADRGDRRGQAGDLRRLQGGGRRPACRRRRPASSSTSSSARRSCATPPRRASRPPARRRRAARTSSTSSTATTSPRTSRPSSPTFCKVLVRYNPEGDAALNQRQAARLKRLSDYLQRRGQQPLHVRAAGAAGAGAARAVRRRQEGLRP